MLPAAAESKSESTTLHQSFSSPNTEYKIEEENGSKSATENLPKFSWMVKPCYFYKDEYTDCKSIKARFHQYFVHGETLQCQQWNEDYQNCYEWNNNGNIESLEKLIHSEKDRVKNRLKAHYDNDVWESRLEPPTDWNSELPANIKDGYETSFLKLKADELKSGKNPEDEKKSPFNLNLVDSACCIM